MTASSGEDTGNGLRVFLAVLPMFGGIAVGGWLGLAHPVLVVSGDTLGTTTATEEFNWGIFGLAALIGFGFTIVAVMVAEVVNAIQEYGPPRR